MNARTRLIIPHAVEVSTLGETERAAMYSLYARHYDATSAAAFDVDLADKRYAVLLHDESGSLQGFSTLAEYERDFGGRTIGVLFSGDTVVDAEHWGQQALAFAWLRLAGAYKARWPDRPLYWFLISKGHRTYRFLTAFARSFWPAHDQPTPRDMQALMDMLAQERFGDAYDSARGLVRFAQSHGHLRAEYAAASEAHRQRPEVDYFLSRNPGYLVGDELVCLCELSAENLRPLPRRVFCGARISLRGSLT